MKVMETVQDLIEEAKLRTVYWGLCIFAVSYFLTNTSKSMWMNVPIAVLFVAAMRILFSEVEFHWKARKIQQQNYLSHLEKKQLSVNDSRLSMVPPPANWKSKIDSPLVEAAMEEFIKKVLKDFVIDLWYSDISPDKEGPELIHSVIMDALGEISERLKDINLVDLLTRDVVDLVGVHIDLFRRNQAAIGVDVMGTLSSEERDDRLKHHLMATKELHPALISPECEYKVMQQYIGGLLAIVLGPREAECPIVRCIAREIVTCLILQPVMNFASPTYINELIEYILLAITGDGSKEVGSNQSPNDVHNHNQALASDSAHFGDSITAKNTMSYNQGPDTALSRVGIQGQKSLDCSGNFFSNTSCEESMHHRPADWARVLEAATQRRTEVLMPENLENMWTKGRNYKNKVQKKAAAVPAPGAKSSGVHSVGHMPGASTATEEKSIVQYVPGFHPDNRIGGANHDVVPLLKELKMEQISTGGCPGDELKDPTSFAAIGNKSVLRRSSSTSALDVQPNAEPTFASESGGTIISEFYQPDFGDHNEVRSVKSASDMVFHSEGLHATKLKCRVIGAYFEKLGSKSFAVYSIAVTDADKNTWFVKRRYRNFERLHRHLKDIPNYTLHLPPKRIFSSSTEDAFVHQRCIQLDKYLQDLLSIANVAEQHEVWDFLSVSSKNYSFGKSSSVMRTLAVNVDDAVDDIVRQFKGVFGASSTYETSPSIPGRNLSWNADESCKSVSLHDTIGSGKSFSDNEDGDKDETHGHDEVGTEESRAHANGWHSDNELNSKGFPPRVVKRDVGSRSLNSERKNGALVKSELSSLGGHPVSSFPASDHLEDPVGVPPEWTPPNLSVPMLNLVDNIFQLKRRGWLRRQVFWMSKQILQLMMEDAIDDWLLRQIQWLRRDDIIALGIRWVQDVLWPDGIFFTRVSILNESNDTQPNPRSSQHSAGKKVSKPGSFEQQLEAARRASDIKKMMFNGAPSTLVSLIGNKQYKRCAKDMYYFLQSTICLKQLAYAILELVLVSIFPEMREILLDVHEKMQVQQSSL